MTEVPHVLLVEDNPADADLIRESLETSGVQVDLSVAVNGAEAVAYLRKQEQYGAAVTPDLILLDLNLPGVHGKTVLRQIKQDAQLKGIPVSVLTSSTAERDVAESYTLGANCYVVKPLDFNNFQGIIQEMQQFWFGIVKLPARNGARARLSSQSGLMT
jgi:two-component system, chemotaxis family, response regulator Rcp1